MDIAFRNARYLANSPARAAELLKDARVMLLTHGHRDHYEESTLLAMAKNDTLFVVPDFLEERTLKLGIPREKLVISRPGERLQLFGLTVLPFESSHYRPDGKGVREYGYHVTTESGITMAFPGDIRDFSKTPKELPPADYCFGHVWLTDEALTEESWRSAVAPWAQYMLGFSQKHIFLTHLWEDGRPDNRMWRTEHALAVQAELGKRSPNTRVTIPARGETVSLV